MARAGLGELWRCLDRRRGNRMGLASPVKNRAKISSLEDMLFREFHGRSALMNSNIPRPPTTNWAKAPEPFQRVQVMQDTEIAEKRTLPFVCQVEYYSQIVNHLLAIKNSREIARAIQAHFERLQQVEVDEHRGQD